MSDPLRIDSSSFAPPSPRYGDDDRCRECGTPLDLLDTGVVCDGCAPEIAPGYSCARCDDQLTESDSDYCAACAGEAADARR